MDDYDNELMERMERLLTATANALHGGYAPPDCLHSWHDLPELVEQLRKERDEARRLYCRAVEEIEHGMTNETERMVADYLGWDCFKEDK